MIDRLDRPSPAPQLILKPIPQRPRQRRPRPLQRTELLDPSAIHPAQLLLDRGQIDAGKFAVAHDGAAIDNHIAHHRCVAPREHEFHWVDIHDRGAGPALNDLVGGHVDFMCEQSVSVAESVLAGSVKAYAVSAGERLATLPNVPTAREAGVDYEMSVWAGLFAPKGVAPEVIAKLADALDKALDEPAVRETLAKLGGSIPAKPERNPAAFDRFVRSEMARWAPILAATRAEK